MRLTGPGSGPAASANVWSRADELEISAALWSLTKQHQTELLMKLAILYLSQVIGPHVVASASVSGSIPKRPRPKRPTSMSKTAHDSSQNAP